MRHSWGRYFFWNITRVISVVLSPIDLPQQEFYMLTFVLQKSCWSTSDCDFNQKKQSWSSLLKWWDVSTISWEYFIQTHFRLNYSYPWKGLERARQKYELKSTEVWKHFALSTFDSVLTYATPLLMIVKNFTKR